MRLGDPNNPRQLPLIRPRRRHPVLHTRIRLPDLLGFRPLLFRHVV